MGTEAYNPEKIPHVKGQDRKIESREKAFEMAYRYDPYNDIAKGYEQYLKKTPEQKSQSEAHEFSKTLEERGVTPDYVRTFGELSAESYGAMLDYQEEALEKTSEELVRDSDQATKELLLFAIDSPTELTSMYPEATVLSQDANVGDRLLNSDANSAVEIQRIYRLASKINVANNELARRKASGSWVG